MDINDVLISLDEKLSPKQRFELKSRLQNIPEEKLNKIPYYPYKLPGAGLALGVIFGMFGADRFYQGNTKKGMIKLMILVIGILTIMMKIGILIILCIWIFSLIDAYLTYKDIQNDNYQKIISSL